MHPWPRVSCVKGRARVLQFSSVLGGSRQEEPRVAGGSHALVSGAGRGFLLAPFERAELRSTRASSVCAAGQTIARGRFGCGSSMIIM